MLERGLRYVTMRHRTKAPCSNYYSQTIIYHTHWLIASWYGEWTLYVWYCRDAKSNKTELSTEVEHQESEMS